MDRGPAQPQPRARPVRRQLGLHTTGYERPAWTFADPEARTGTVERHRRPSDALGRDVDIDVYLPARFRLTRQYPLLVVHDGHDYLVRAMKTVLDNLIHRLEIAEVVVAFTNPPDRLASTPTTNRTPATSPRSSCRSSRPAPAGDHPAARGLMGASFGAVASFSVARRYPGRFGRLLLQSGSFAFTDIGDATSAARSSTPVVAVRQRLPGRARGRSASGSSSAAACTSR